MKIKKWISNFISGLLLVIFLLVTFFVFYSKISGGKPNVFGYELMTVLSGSMEPTIKTGSVIAVKPITNPDKCKVGDVITYRSLDDANTLITHRIIKVESSGKTVQYITKGDNNKDQDPKPIPPSKLTGTYDGFTIPSLGYVSNFVKSKTGMILFLIVPGVILVVSQLVGIWKEIARLEDKENNDKKEEITNCNTE